MTKQTLYPIGTRLQVTIGIEELCTVVDCPEMMVLHDDEEKIWIIFDRKEAWGDKIYYVTLDKYHIKKVEIDIGDLEDDL